MNHYQKALALLVVAALGCWGCAQGPAGGAEKLKGLEAKVTRLEEDFRSATAARDQFRKKLSDTEATVAQLRQEIDAFAKERDELRVQLKARTTERDNLTQQFDGFRKNLKDLLGQAEAAMAKPAVPAITTTASQPKNPNL